MRSGERGGYKVNPFLPILLFGNWQFSDYHTSLPEQRSFFPATADRVETAGRSSCQVKPTRNTLVNPMAAMW
jgi:hypothetical protein